MGTYSSLDINLCSCHEAGLSVVLHKVCNVVPRKGKQQIARLSPTESDSVVTVDTYRSAAGHFELPLLVYPRVDITAELLQTGLLPAQL